jgi:hypothetical protein
MLNKEKVEDACADRQPYSFSGAMLDSAALPLTATFYPYGFPAEVRTNSDLVLGQFHDLWGKFIQQRQTPPFQCDVQLVDCESSYCPPPPVYRLMLPLLTCVADADNHSILDLESGRATITVSRSALGYPAYVQYFLLGTSLACLTTQSVTPIHAACVSLGGRGVLLCGESGAGKSSLSYACARAGWTYVADDGSYLVDAGQECIVAGNCYKVRFRPSAAELFPELKGLPSTISMTGKPSIEWPTCETPFSRAQEARAGLIVFLNRHSANTPQLVPYSKDLARQSMRGVLFGPARSLAAQYAAIDKLLDAVPVCELRYRALDGAVDILQKLVGQKC